MLAGDITGGVDLGESGQARPYAVLRDSPPTLPSLQGEIQCSIPKLLGDGH